MQPLRRGITLIVTAAEETGSAGARYLAKLGVLGRASALLVGEPTSNRLAVAHKGALHLQSCLGCPTVILGPGEAGEAHQTDEYSLVSNIEAVAGNYFQIAREWCAR
jgi:acetylornithine deacetylase/succinyl-diaminopimelate desuccinylase-like protein